MARNQKMFITSVSITSTGGSSTSHVPYVYIDVRDAETIYSVTGRIYREMLERFPHQRICISHIEVYECLNPVRVTELQK